MSIFSSKRASFMAAILLFLHLATALQVSPNSPCASFCLDAPDLDKPDPESSNTKGEDITCKDDDFNSRLEGQKFQRCLTCLQDSAFSEGHETDQQWFFYNLRYSFDYCVLGYPNATNIESSPCVTSEACGRIEEALKEGILEPAHAEPFGYCDVNNGVMLSRAVEDCLSCVRAGNSNHYLSNFLIALQAGCEQKPGPGIMVGLSDTVFTTNPINIVAPHAALSNSSSSAPPLSPPIIAAIAIGSLVLLFLATGCTFMQVRKRRNRAKRSASPLSFRCQMKTPMTPRFPSDEKMRERAHLDALRLNPVSQWFTSENIVDTKPSNVAKSIPAPPPTYSSPRMSSPHEHFTTPTSTTSSAPLLYPLNTPKKYPVAEEVSPYDQPRDLETLPKSPRSEHRAWYARQSWEQQDLTRDLTKKNKNLSGTSPVSMNSIQTSFPPPPKR